MKGIVVSVSIAFPFFSSFLYHSEAYRLSMYIGPKFIITKGKEKITLQNLLSTCVTKDCWRVAGWTELMSGFFLLYFYRIYPWFKDSLYRPIMFVQPVFWTSCLNMFLYWIQHEGIIGYSRDIAFRSDQLFNKSLIIIHFGL